MAYEMCLLDINWRLPGILDALLALIYCRARWYSPLRHESLNTTEVMPEAEARWEGKKREEEILSKGQ